MNRFQGLFALMVLVCLCATCAAREWTAKNGNKFRGDFVRVRGQFVQIRVTSIRVINVPFLNLSDEDQEYVRTELKKSGDEHLLDFAKRDQSGEAGEASGQVSGIPDRSRGGSPAGPVITNPEGVGAPGGQTGPGRFGPTPGVPRGPGKSPGPSVPTGPSSFPPTGINGGPFAPGGVPGRGSPGQGTPGQGTPGKGSALAGPTPSGVPGREPGSSAPPFPNTSIPSPSLTPPPNPFNSRVNSGPTSRPNVSGGLSRLDSQPIGPDREFSRGAPPTSPRNEVTDEQAERAVAVIGTSVLLLGLSCFAATAVVIVGGVVLIVQLAKRKPSGPTYYRY